MVVRVLAFARIREILGAVEAERTVEAGATVRALWDALARDYPPLAALRASTRFARNGTLVAATQTLADGDEVALLPPYGGG